MPSSSQKMPETPTPEVYKNVRTRGQAKKKQQDIGSSLGSIKEEKKHENVI